MELSADPGVTMTVWTAEPGSKSAEGLQLLGSWAATVEPANLAHTRAWSARRSILGTSLASAPSAGRKRREARDNVLDASREMLAGPAGRLGT